MTKAKEQPRNWHTLARQLAAESQKKDDDALESFSRQIIPAIRSFPHLQNEALLDIVAEFGSLSNHDPRMMTAYKQYAKAASDEILRRLKK